jgi:hypothetical protein
VSLNKKFAKLLQDGLRQQQCAGLELESFLLEPVQRLARYPLLLRQVLHYTDNKTAEHLGLQRALQASEKALHLTNEAVREAENRAKLSEIHERLLKGNEEKRKSVFSLFRSSSCGLADLV